MKLVILGSSAGLASKTRAGSCYLVDCGDEGVLFDIGDGATRNFLANGYTPDWIKHIVITHMHADHVGGIGYFLQQRYLSGTDKPLTIHCPGESAGPIKAIFNFGYMFKDKLPFKIEFKPHVERYPSLIGPLRVTPYPTTHLIAMRSFAEDKGLPNRGECYAMRIELGGKVVVYSADIGSIDDLDAVQLPIDWLLVESTHVALERLWPWVEERKVKHVVITHIADSYDLSKVALGKSQTSAEIMIAEDGLSLDI